MSKGYVYPAGESGMQPNPDLVRAELERLLQSDQFKKSRRCQSLLSYVVEETIAGRGDQIKERQVGIHVFGRNPDYETAEDPVVRNAAIEVRKRLAQFYIESGSDATVRIDLQPGAYVPEFLLPKEKLKIQEPKPQPTVRCASRAIGASASEDASGEYELFRLAGPCHTGCIPRDSSEPLDTL